MVSFYMQFLFVSNISIICFMIQMKPDWFSLLILYTSTNLILHHLGRAEILNCAFSNGIYNSCFSWVNNTIIYDFGLMVFGVRLWEYRYHLNDCWISSRVLPFVSGTHIVTNNTVKEAKMVYMVKVPVKIGVRNAVVYEESKQKRQHAIAIYQAEC